MNVTLNICSKRVTRKKAPAGVRAAKLAKAKKTSVPRKAKVVRRETRSSRKRRHEEGDMDEGSSPKRQRGEDESFEVLSGDELALEELAGDPTESEFEAAAGPTAVGQPTPRQPAAETAKMCAADKVRS